MTRVIGDLVDVPEQKSGVKAAGHAAIVNTNIVNMINGRAFVDYTAPKEMLVVNIGPIGGMGYFVTSPLRIKVLLEG